MNPATIAITKIDYDYMTVIHEDMINYLYLAFVDCLG